MGLKMDGHSGKALPCGILQLVVGIQGEGMGPEEGIVQAQGTSPQGNEDEGMEGTRP